MPRRAGRRQEFAARPAALSAAPAPLAAPPMSPPELPPRGWARHQSCGLRNAPGPFPTACLHGDAFVPISRRHRIVRFPEQRGLTSRWPLWARFSPRSWRHGRSAPQPTTAAGHSLPCSTHRPGQQHGGVPAALVLLYRAMLCCAMPH